MNLPRPIFPRQGIEVEKRLLDDLEDGLPRIEGGERVLVDELDLPAELAQGFARAGSSTSTPSTRMRPEVGFWKPTMLRAVVVLPEPDSPTIAWVVPRGTLKEMSSTARKASRLPPSGEILHEVLDDDGVIAAAEARGSGPGHGADLAERRRIGQKLARVLAARRSQNLRSRALLLNASALEHDDVVRPGPPRRPGRGSPAERPCRIRGAARRSDRGCASAPSRRERWWARRR